MTPNQPGSDPETDEASGFEEVESFDAEDDALDDRVDSQITVVVADDHPMWRDAVARDLTDAGFQVVATAADGLSAINRVKATTPDVLVLDLNLPGVHGVGVCEQLATEDLPTKILILSVSGERQDVLDAVKAGASGYLVKSTAREEFLEAVRRTARGRAVFTPGLAGLVLGEFRRMQNAGSGASAAPQLTERETEVLKLVATGMSYKDIAAQLYISHRTVQNHVQNTLGKLQMHNRVELVRYAISKGLHRD
jgi:DNA-binding NarL/FixJ family response regulator